MRARYSLAWCFGVTASSAFNADAYRASGAYYYYCGPSIYWGALVLRYLQLYCCPACMSALCCMGALGCVEPSGIILPVTAIEPSYVRLN